MNYRIGNFVFSVPPKTKNSNDLLHIYHTLAEQAVSDFQKSYQAQIHNLEALVHSAPSCFASAIQPALQKTNKMLMDHGVYDVDSATFVNQYFDSSAWDAAYEQLEEQYIDIVATEEQKDAYRVARRQNRGRWQGGGFGFGGAVKGAAKAGAMNMATGAAHMAFNGVAKVGSMMSASMKCSSIFSNPKTFRSLASGVYDAVVRLAQSYAKCLADHGDSSLLSGFPTKAEQNKAVALMNNAKMLPADDTRLTSILQEAFQNDPYCNQIYQYLLDHNRSEIKTIRAMATMFLRANYIDEYCYALLKQAVATYDLSTEEHAKQAKADYQKLLDELSFQDTLAFLPHVEAKLTEFDRIARTFENVEYPTREQAAKAREEAQWIDALLANIKDQSLAELTETRKKILEKCEVQAVIEKRLKKLDKRIAKQDRQERTVDGIEFENQEDAAQAKQDVDFIRNELQDATLLSLDQLKEKREAIASHCSSDLAQQYLKKLDAAIQKKEKKKGKKIPKGYLNFKTPKQYKPHLLRNTILIVLVVLIALALLPESNQDNTAVDTVPENAVTEPETPTIEKETEPAVVAASLYDYVGSWMVDRYNSYTDGFVGFIIENNNDQFYFSANGVWNQGTHVTNIAYAQIELNYDGTQAGGYYEDDRGNTGNVILSFENGELYLTVTVDSGGNYSFAMLHEHCTRDYDTEENISEPESAPQAQSYTFYHEDHTYSNGMDILSGYTMGEDHLWPTDTLVITDADLNELTRMEVAAIRNEIYARHGYTFSSQEWADFFATATWYVPNAAFSNDMLNTTEKQNAETIGAYEKAQGWNQ